MSAIKNILGMLVIVGVIALVQSAPASQQAAKAVDQQAEGVEGSDLETSASYGYGYYGSPYGGGYGYPYYGGLGGYGGYGGYYGGYYPSYSYRHFGGLYGGYYY